MLTPEENDLLCRVEGKAPMGQLMRRHWVPICLQEEVPDPDGTPVKARILGEDLVVFRATDGRVGVLAPTGTPNLGGEDFGRFVAAEIKRWAEVVTKAKIRIE